MIQVQSIMPRESVMEIVVLSMAAVCFMFGLIAITRVDQISKEGQQIRIH